MFMMSMLFLLSYSRHIKFTTIELLDSREKEEIKKALATVHKTYKKAGFHVSSYIMNNEFEILRQYIEKNFLTHIEVCAANDHVLDAERRIWVVKKQVQSAYDVPPFKHVPLLLFVELVCVCVFWLKYFPNKKGISDRIGPIEIMTNMKLDLNKITKIAYGDYAQVHQKTVTNSMESRMVAVICLGPSVNVNVSYRWYSLYSGKVLYRIQFTSLPMPIDVIHWIEYMTKILGHTQELTFHERKMDNIEEKSLLAMGRMVPYTKTHHCKYTK